jgi:hypothetical protein
VKERGRLPASEDPLNASPHDLPEMYGKMTALCEIASKKKKSSE